MRRIAAVGLFTFGVVSGSFALEESPWLPEAYLPILDAKFCYSTYPRVNDASYQLSSRSHDQLGVLGLGIANLTGWGADVEAELAHTPRLPWGFRSAAGQIRKQWLDDISGDLMSLTSGINMRVVGSKAIHDVSTPFHDRFNSELTTSLGKEWSDGFYWICRVFGFVGVGTANRGSPWLRGKLAFQGNWENKFQYHLFAEAYRGYGDEKRVNTKDFSGWKSFDHRSLDAGAALRFRLGFSGYLTLEFKQRVFARSFPEKVSFFLLRYTLPLSL